MIRLGTTIPALPVRDVARAVGHYRDAFRFSAKHEEEGFAVLVRDDARLHLWLAGDRGWHTRDDLAERPICSGAEDFLAGTASCRIEVEDVDALLVELAPRGVLHPTARPEVHVTDFGTREFATVDLDGNLLEFFCRVPDDPPATELPRTVWLPGPLRIELRLGARETSGAFCLAVDHPPPGWSLPPHRHTNESETIHVLDGRFELEVEGMRRVSGPGDTVHVPRGVEHSGRTLGEAPGRRILVFAPAGIERFFLAADGERDASRLGRLAGKHGWRF